MSYLCGRDETLRIFVPYVYRDEVDVQRWREFIDMALTLQEYYNESRKHVRACNLLVNKRVAEKMLSSRENIEVCFDAYESMKMLRDTAIEDFKKMMLQRFPAEEALLGSLFDALRLLSKTRTSATQLTARSYEYILRQFRDTECAYIKCLPLTLHEKGLLDVELRVHRRELAQIVADMRRCWDDITDMERQYAVDVRLYTHEVRSEIRQSVPTRLKQLMERRTMYKQQWARGEFKCPMLEHEPCFAVALAIDDMANDDVTPGFQCRICALASKLIKL